MDPKTELHQAAQEASKAKSELLAALGAVEHAVGETERALEIATCKAKDAETVIHLLKSRLDLMKTR